MTAARNVIRFPKHDYAEKHQVLRARKQWGTSSRMKKLERLEEAGELTASGEVAYARIREYAYDIGAEYEFAYGWKARAAEELGLCYATMWKILESRVGFITSFTVDRVARRTGVPVPVFYDPEL